MTQRRKPQTRDVTVYLPLDLFDAVDKAAAAENMPRTYFVQRALTYYFNAHKS